MKVTLIILKDLNCILKKGNPLRSFKKKGTLGDRGGRAVAATTEGSLKCPKIRRVTLELVKGFSFCLPVSL